MSSLDSGTSLWWLERDQEEDLYLVCNGKRGRSRRSEFGNIVSVTQRDDKFKVSLHVSLLMLLFLIVLLTCYFIKTAF